MRVVELSCRGCGAPLDGSWRKRFVRCDFCGQRNAIEASPDGATTAMAFLKRADAVRRLDRAWARRRKEFVTRDQHGRTHTPDVAGAYCFYILALFAGSILVSTGRWGPALLTVLGGAALGTVLLARAKAYQNARRAYLLKRTRVSLGLAGTLEVPKKRRPRGLPRGRSV